MTDAELNKAVLAVVGHTRSGTSLMMQMLDAAGVECYHDEGSGWPAFETTRVFGLPGDADWLRGVVGKAVKLVDPDQFPLPDLLPVPMFAICMHRDHTEAAKSALKMLGMHATAGRVRVLAADMRDRYRAEVSRLQRLLHNRMMHVRFESMIREPKRIAAHVAAFIGRPEAAPDMAGCVLDRGSKCYDGFIEAQLIEMRAALAATEGR